MSSDRDHEKPIVSAFRNDPDMVPIIEEFVVELSKQIASLRQTFESGQVEGLQRLAHQLKGAGSGYGYEPITLAAAKLESAIKTSTGDLESVRGQFEELIELCQRAKV